MKKKSLATRITEYLQKIDHWVCGGDIQELAMKAGYEAQNAGRRLRELTEDGTLEVKYVRGNNNQDVAWYRYKKQEVLKKVPVITEVNGERVVTILEKKVLV